MSRLHHAYVYESTPCLYLRLSMSKLSAGWHHIHVERRQGCGIRQLMRRSENTSSRWGVTDPQCSASALAVRPSELSYGVTDPQCSVSARTVRPSELSYGVTDPQRSASARAVRPSHESRDTVYLQLMVTKHRYTYTFKCKKVTSSMAMSLQRRIYYHCLWWGHISILSVMLLQRKWGTPSCSRSQLATDKGVRDGRSNWLAVTPNP